MCVRLPAATTQKRKPPKEQQQQRSRVSLKPPPEPGCRPVLWALPSYKGPELGVAKPMCGWLAGSVLLEEGRFTYCTVILATESR